ncbi:MAG TPA: hypothetical protein VM779_15110 [Thermoanaerobaculia bacterium]|nr:hypothetical protein [Thermoanaerobaculia bacterium]
MTALYIGIGAVLALLLRNLFKRLASNRLGAMSQRRRAGSLIVSRGELVNGKDHMDVALALTDSMFIYENRRLEGCLERSTIHEVEYENELVTGQPVREGKVLRLRCFSTTFEFVLPADAVGKWQLVLPPHRITTA